MRGRTHSPQSSSLVEGTFVLESLGCVTLRVGGACGPVEVGEGTLQAQPPPHWMGADIRPSPSTSEGDFQP